MFGKIGSDLVTEELGYDLKTTNVNWNLFYGCVMWWLVIFKASLILLIFVTCYFLSTVLAVNQNWLHYSIRLAKPPYLHITHDTHSRLILSLMHLLSPHDWTSHEYCNTGPEKTRVILTCWNIIHGSEHFSTSAKTRTLPSCPSWETQFPA